MNESADENSIVLVVRFCLLGVALWDRACSSIEPLWANQANTRTPGPPKTLRLLIQLGL
jgi:hypothetical protein